MSLQHTLDAFSLRVFLLLNTYFNSHMRYSNFFSLIIKNCVSRTLSVHMPKSKYSGHMFGRKWPENGPWRDRISANFSYYQGRALVPRVPRVASRNNRKIAFPGKSLLHSCRWRHPGRSTSSKYVYFRTIAPHAKFSMHTRARSAYELYTTRPAVRLFAPRSSPWWQTGKTCPNFALWPLYRVFAMTSRTTINTWCKNSEVDRSRVPLYQ
jgi:hypothetical protein